MIPDVGGELLTVLGVDGRCPNVRLGTECGEQVSSAANIVKDDSACTAASQDVGKGIEIRGCISPEHDGVVGHDCESGQKQTGRSDGHDENGQFPAYRKALPEQDSPLKAARPSSFIGKQRHVFNRAMKFQEDKPIRKIGRADACWKSIILTFFARCSKSSKAES